MCFYVKINKKYIAKKDIICYKAGYTKKLAFLSLVMGKTYKYNRLYKIRGKLTPIVIYSGHTIIHKGFHSYNTLDIAKSFSHVVRCIIPKGAEYYVNNSERVSNQIIIKKAIT